MGAKQSKAELNHFDQLQDSIVAMKKRDEHRLQREGKDIKNLHYVPRHHVVIEETQNDGSSNVESVNKRPNIQCQETG